MPPKTPKTVLDKVVVAIRALKGATGSSRQAIAKYLKAEFNLDNSTALKTALKKGVKDALLVQVGQSFKVAGEEYEAPPEERVEIVDVKVGSGEVAEVGDDVEMSYVGKIHGIPMGPQFDAAKSFVFTLGAGDVIKGWDLGVKGMRVGGERTLVVPPKLGYGKKGSGPDIPPDSTLHFKVTLKSIKQ